MLCFNSLFKNDPPVYISLIVKARLLLMILAYILLLSDYVINGCKQLYIYNVTNTLHTLHGEDNFFNRVSLKEIKHDILSLEETGYDQKTSVDVVEERSQCQYLFKI